MKNGPKPIQAVYSKVVFIHITLVKKSLGSRQKPRTIAVFDKF